MKYSNYGTIAASPEIALRYYQIHCAMDLSDEVGSIRAATLR